MDTGNEIGFESNYHICIHLAEIHLSYARKAHMRIFEGGEPNIRAPTPRNQVPERSTYAISSIRPSTFLPFLAPQKVLTLGYAISIACRLDLRNSSA